MRFLGKIIGAIFGWLLAGPIGMIIGIFIGHLFDQGLETYWQKPLQFGGSGEAQQAFFKATFLLMGHIAKADGRVSEKEIQAARSIMSRMGLSEQQRQRAIELFEQGKNPSFNATVVLDDLIRECHHNKILLRLFLELQMQTALADGMISPQKQRILQTICQRFGFPPLNFVFSTNYFDFGSHTRQEDQRQYNYQGHYRSSNQSSLQEAYQILGVNSSVTDVEAKRAYRKLMSQHHPDKLMAKGLPEEMVKLATEKTQKIKAAYDRICEARGIK